MNMINVIKLTIIIFIVFGINHIRFNLLDRLYNLKVALCFLLPYIVCYIKYK